MVRKLYLADLRRNTTFLTRATPCHAVSCRPVSSRAAPCRVIPCRAVPCQRRRWWWSQVGHSTGSILMSARGLGLSRPASDSHTSGPVPIRYRVVRSRDPDPDSAAAVPELDQPREVCSQPRGIASAAKRSDSETEPD